MGGFGRFPSLGGSLLLVLSLPYLRFFGLFFLLSSTHRESLSEVSRCRHAALDRLLHRPTETYAVSAVSLSFLFSLFSVFVSLIFVLVLVLGRLCALVYGRCLVVSIVLAKSLPVFRFSLEK